MDEMSPIDTTLDNTTDRYCLKCGYALRGLPQPRCPECCRPFDVRDPRTFDDRPRSGRLPWGRLLPWTLSLAGLHLFVVFVTFASLRDPRTYTLAAEVLFTSLVLPLMLLERLTRTLGISVSLWVGIVAGLANSLAYAAAITLAVTWIRAEYRGDR
jgi:hypothetical protein